MTITIGPAESTLISVWIIGILVLAVFGWLFAEKVTNRPLEKTYIEVVIGCGATLIGEVCLGWSVAYYLSIPFWSFVFVVIAPIALAWATTGGIMIYWQDRKHREDSRGLQTIRNSRQSINEE